MVSPKRSTKPSVSVTKIPSIKALCEALGFQHASLKDTNLFMAASHAWRKSFVTSTGKPGINLLAWNKPQVQIDLKEMAEGFVERSNNGERYWGTGRNWDQDQGSDIVFPDDRPQIIELLKQLFWKQNRYAANNGRYPSEDGQSTSIPQDGISMTRDSASVTQEPELDILFEVNSVLKGQMSSYDAEETSPWSEYQTKEHGEAHSGSRVEEASIERDEYLIYEGPNDTVEDDDGFHNITKNTDVDQLSKVASNLNIPRKRKRHTVDFQQSPRRTGRKRAAVVNPDRVSTPELEDQLRSDGEMAAENSPSARNSSRRETHDNLSSEAVSDGQSMANSHRFVAPVAPMTVIDISDNEGPPSPSYGTIIEQQAANRASQTSSISFNLKLANKPSTELDDRHQRAPSPISQSGTSKIQSELPVNTLHEPSHTNDGKKEPSNLKSDSTRMPIPSSRDKLSAPHQAQRSSGRGEIETQHTKQASRRPSIAKLSQPKPLRRHKQLKKVANQGTNNSNPASDSSVGSYGLEQSKNQPPKPLPLSNQVNSGEDISTEPKETLVSTTSTKADSQVSTPSEEISMSKSRSRTQVPLWIITRQPRYTEERWDEGKFQGTALPVFIQELSQVTGRSHIEKMKLTLQTPLKDIKVTVLKDAEDQWQSAKEEFVKKIKEAIVEAKKRSNEAVSFKVLIEPIFDENAALSSTLVEDEIEIDF
ncbi:hypothetical protein B0O99DRAFT_617516 [Bisporella sp. PMI_857]|nr:hypothetical protein B0O99DRAFT_617516 [Bisporella sp. PMI_857]